MNSPDPAGWKIKVTEVSDGVYKAHGRNGDGEEVEATGTDPELVREQCKLQASKYNRLIEE